ncbi:MAG TPA: EamA family transporter [Sphingobacteriaceae bacterium]
MKERSEPSPLLIVLAFAAVYLIWGSTYLGIAIAIKSIPPMVMGGTRFLVAGTILFLWCYLVRKDRSQLKDWKQDGVIGALMIFGGNGAVVWVEQYLPSGLVAVAVASIPIWLAVLDRGNWRVTFSRAMPVIGLIVGFAGVVFLFTSGQKIPLNNSPLAAISIPVLILGNICWAMGTLYSKKVVSTTSVFMRVSVQMITGGLIYAVAGLFTGEWRSFDTEGMELQSLLALLYLIVFGSLVAYLAYIWLLTVRPAAQVGTYAYVNPAVAVFLGFIFNNEQLTLATGGALVLILGGVVLINLSYQRNKKPAIQQQQ